MSYLLRLYTFLKREEEGFKDLVLLHYSETQAFWIKLWELRIP